MVSAWMVDAAGFVAPLLAGGFVGWGLAWKVLRSVVRREAVDAGVAKWECDPATGETRFVWVTSKEGSDE